MKHWFLFMVFGLIVAACSARRGEVVGRPVEVDNPKEELGQVLFYKNCHYCHPGGAAGLGPALNNKPLPRRVISFQVRNGIGAMPAFDDAKIDSQELEAVIEYVVTLRTGD